MIGLVIPLQTFGQNCHHLKSVYTVFQSKQPTQRGINSWLLVHTGQDVMVDGLVITSYHFIVLIIIQFRVYGPPAHTAYTARDQHPLRVILPVLTALQLAFLLEPGSKFLQLSSWHFSLGPTQYSKPLQLSSWHCSLGPTQNPNPLQLSSWHFSLGSAQNPKPLQLFSWHFSLGTVWT